MTVALDVKLSLNIIFLHPQEQHRVVSQLSCRKLEQASPSIQICSWFHCLELCHKLFLKIQFIHFSYSRKLPLSQTPDFVSSLPFLSTSYVHFSTRVASLVDEIKSPMSPSSLSCWSSCLLQLVWDWARSWYLVLNE